MSTSAHSRPPTPSLIACASIRQQAEANLQATIDEQVGGLNAFFGDMRRDITDAGSSASQLLSQQSSLSSGAYWDATTSVIQLPGGGWDNPSSTDPASIFLQCGLHSTKS
jgi:hypothetical protein